MSDTDYEKLIESQQRTINNLSKWQSETNKVLEQIVTMLESHTKELDDSKKLLEDLKKLSVVNRWRIESLPYETLKTDSFDELFQPKIMTLEETRRQIIKEHKSIARLGDGEIALASGIKRWNFQNPDKRLSDKLVEILRSDPEDGFLVGLNPNFYNLSHLSEETADEVRSYMRPDVRRKHCELLRSDRVYADALIHRIDSEEDVAILKELWDGRDCLFVEGKYTRMGVGNDLFDNCRSIKRILGPSVDSFDCYDAILKEVKKQPKDRLVLLAMGPTATALAYELFKEGYWAVDIGRVDLLYEKYIANLPNLYSVRIPYKYCNADESGPHRTIEDVDDETYNSQIIAQFG